MALNDQMTEISKNSGFFLGKLDKKVAKLLKFQNIWLFFLEKSGKKWLNDSNDQGVNFLGRPKVAHIEPYLITKHLTNDRSVADVWAMYIN